MRPGKLIVLGLTALPLAEIVVFVIVAVLLGFGKALALMLATSLAGALVLRAAGRARLKRFRMAATDRTMTGFEAQGGDLLTVLGGILLLIPGFVTDCLGLLLLFPAVRRWLGATVRRVLQRSGGQADSVVDLDRSEWDRVPEKRLPREGA